MTGTPAGDAADAFAAFFATHCGPALLALLWQPEEVSHPFLPVDTFALFAHAPALAAALLDAPLQTLGAAAAGLARAQAAALRGDGAGRAPVEAPAGAVPSAKPAARCRFDAHRLALPGVTLVDAGGLRERHLGRLVALRGCVARAGPLRLRQATSLYECARCGGPFMVHLDAETGAVALPAKCPIRGAACGDSPRFRAPPPPPPGVPPPRERCEDVCEVLLAPPHSSAAARSAAGGTLTVLCAELAAGPLAPRLGDEVLACGVVRRRLPKAPRAGERPASSLVFHVHAAALLPAPPPALRRRIVPDGDPLAEWRSFWAQHAATPLGGRNTLLAAFCPPLHGLALPKLACALALAGGVPGRGAAGAPVRGEAHILLCGDPGTGKSALLRAAAALAPRAVLAAGGAATAAGLAAAAVREPSPGGGWALEAGALVRAHRGVCCVDELDALPAAQRDALHEALEAQQVTVAKAGLQARLPCACTLLAACNARPTGSTLDAITGLPPPLLSRFDVVLLLRDAPPGGRGGAADAAKAEAVLAARLGGARVGCEASPTGGYAWDGARLGRYLAAVREHLHPPLTPAAAALCGAFYQSARAARGGGGGGRATPRLLESCVRLTQAHARLLCRSSATPADALQAILLLRAASAAATTGGGPSLADAPAPAPDAAAVAAQTALMAEFDATLGPGWQGAAEEAPLARLEAAPADDVESPHPSQESPPRFAAAPAAVAAARDSWGGWEDWEGGGDEEGPLKVARTDDGEF